MAKDFMRQCCVEGEDVQFFEEEPSDEQGFLAPQLRGLGVLGFRV